MKTYCQSSLVQVQEWDGTPEAAAEIIEMVAKAITEFEITFVDGKLYLAFKNDHRPMREPIVLGLYAMVRDGRFVGFFPSVAMSDFLHDWEEVDG